MEECPQCHTADSFVLRDGRYACRVCGYEDQRRAEYEMDEECNFIDFTKTNAKLMTELKRSVKQSRRKKGDGVRKKCSKAIPIDKQIPRVPLNLFEKRYRRKVQPDEKEPPGDVLPRRHYEVEIWKRVSHRLSTFTQLLARTTRFLVREKRATENVKPVAMVIWRRLLASQGIAFTDAEWTAVEEDRYSATYRKITKKVIAVVTADQQRADAAAIAAEDNERLRTGQAAGEGGMWSMLMSDAVTEQLQVAAVEPEPGTRLKTKRKIVEESEFRKRPTETSMYAMARAGLLTLNLELLVAVSFLACRTVGARVGMADLVRWFREARVALPPHFLHDLTKVKFCDDAYMIQLESCRYEAHFNFYLHEANSFLQRVMSATRVPRRRLSIRLDEIIASHLAALNLPFALMERVLVVLTRARVDTVDLSIEQADEEGRYCNENTCSYRMEEGRVHPMLSTSYRAPFITYSPDTRAMAAILLVLRLTFGLRDDRAFEVKNSRFFNVGSWLRQLRARTRVYGGDEGETVVKESTRESPRDYGVEWNMEVGRTDLVQLHGKLTYRQKPRASFPEGFDPLPKLDGDRYLYRDGPPFPEDGESTRAREGRVAMMTPLIYHGERVREEWERKGGEESKDRQMREAFKLIGMSFKELEIEEASESLQPTTSAMKRERAEEDGEVAEEWRHLFPAAVNFEISRLPPLSVTSLVRFDNRRGNGRYMIGGGAGDIAFAFVTAASGLSRPHRFLLQTMSRLIVEAPSVLHAACSMLERRMLRYQSCLSLVQSLESGAPVLLADCSVQSMRARRQTRAVLSLKRAAGEARNIIDVTISRREEGIRKKIAKSKEFVTADDDSSMAPSAMGDQSTRIDEDFGGEVDDDVNDEEESANEDDDEDEEGENDDLDPMVSMVEGEGESDEDGVEIVEAQPAADRPCVRYNRAQDKCNPVVEGKYYLNFDYLWSVLAMRMW